MTYCTLEWHQERHQERHHLCAAYDLLLALRRPDDNTLRAAALTGCTLLGCHPATLSHHSTAHPLRPSPSPIDSRRSAVAVAVAVLFRGRLRCHCDCDCGCIIHVCGYPFPSPRHTSTALSPKEQSISWCFLGTNSLTGYHPRQADTTLRPFYLLGDIRLADAAQISGAIDALLLPSLPPLW